MNERREAQLAVRSALTSAETLLNAMGRVPAGTREYLQLVREARDQVRAADAGLRKLNRKPEGSCEMQDCWKIGTHYHATIGNAKIVLCEAHSATSLLPLFRGERGER